MNLILDWDAGEFNMDWKGLLESHIFHTLVPIDG